MAGSARRAEVHLVCRPGCTECCIGPFSITQLDAERLLRGLRDLESRDAKRAAAVCKRAAGAARELSRGFPGEARTGVLAEDEKSIGKFLTTHEDLPCPALDPSTGLCDLHAFRPITCRSFGPPVSIGGKKLPPCHLCFTKASAKEARLQRTRVRPAGGRSPLSRKPLA
jgi:Fe-S-cluster containining protein